MPYVSSFATSRIEWSVGPLSILLQDSGLYGYYRAPEKVYDAFLTPASKGTSFNDHIRDRYLVFGSGM